MSNRTRSRKISSFLGQTSLPVDAFLTHVSQNTNFKISKSDFANSLGVTGTIEQSGDPLGTPILDKAGSVNNIRTLEPGSGIKTSVSPQNGAIIEHDFIEDTSGAELVEDLAAAQPKFRSLTAGPGIAIGASGGEIQISATVTPGSTKTIIVDDINDFPDPVGGVITLEDETEYLMRNDITTDNRFVMGQNTVIRDSSPLLITFTYTGTGVMFTSVNKSWAIRNIKISCTAGTFCSFTGSGAEDMQLIETRIEANILGNIQNFRAVFFNSTTFIVTTNGFLFDGICEALLIQGNISTINAGILYDFKNVISVVSIYSGLITLNGSSVFLNGFASDSNISGNIAVVANNAVSGTGTPVTGITDGNNNRKWTFRLNGGIPDTEKFGISYFTNNLTETVIATAGIPVKINATYSDVTSGHFQSGSLGGLEYNGPETGSFEIDVSVSSYPVSGNNKSISYFLALNGSIITDSEVRTTITTGQPLNSVINWQLDLSPGDIIEPFVANNADTANIISTDCKIRASQ